MKSSKVWLNALPILLFLISCSRNEPANLELLESVPDLKVALHQPIELTLPIAGHPLLVEIGGTGANLSSRILDADFQILSDVHFEYLRSAPLYHYIAADQEGKALRLLLQADKAESAARVSVKFFSIPGTDRRLNEAWRTMANGQQRVASLDKVEWTKNLQSLQAARQQFDALGLSEPALWADYLVAYVQYFPLYDYSQAAAGALRILKSVNELPRNRSMDILRLLAHQLTGQIWLESDAGLDNAAVSATESARAHFIAAHELAETLALPFEAIWANNNIGISYFYEQQLQLALHHYSKALAQAQEREDNNLVSLVGSNVAIAQERMGNISEAVQTLENIQQKARQSSLMERENVLSLLGSNYLKLYRFPEALNALNEAMMIAELLHSSEDLGHNGILLGRVYREMGQTDKALALAKSSIPHLQAANNQRGLRHAHGLHANIARVQGEFAEMNHQRELEGALLITGADSASWHFNKGLDQAAQGMWTEAAEQFRKSAEAYAASGFSTSSSLATLNACAAASSLAFTADCTIEQLTPLFEEIQQMQAFTPALQGKFVWARLLQSQDDNAAALTLTDELVADIQHYRNTLPGVLGAWYWDARQAVFDFYLQLIFQSPDQPAGKPAMLLALDWLRNSAGTYNRDPAAEGLRAAMPKAEPPARATQQSRSFGDLRELLARRDQASSPEELMQTQRLIDNELMGRNGQGGHAEDSRSVAEVDDFIQELARLPEDWSLLTYYLGGPNALAWVGNREGLELFELGPSEPILELIGQVKSTIRAHNDPRIAARLAALGEHLLLPVQSHLKFRILVSSSGVLADLPIEALLIEGQPFIRTHQLVHSESVQRISTSIALAHSRIEPEKIFLAGYSDGSSSGLAALPSANQELKAVRAAFPAAEAFGFSEQTLSIDELGGKKFQEADLIHLASHALIDREYPELSRLALPVPAGGEPAYLMPADIDYLQLSARLIVLSACETVGTNHFDFDGHLGFVTQLLQQTDGLVIASLWPVADRATSNLMSAFYQSLAEGSDVPTALRTAKLQQLEATQPGNRSWAAFQLFTR